MPEQIMNIVNMNNANRNIMNIINNVGIFNDSLAMKNNFKE